MRRTIALLLVASLAMPLHADPGRGPGPGRYGNGGGHGGFDWFGLALFSLFTTLIFVSEQNRAQPEPQQGRPIYIEGPASTSTPPTEQADTWYYCGSSAMYYPYTQSCPEGWQAIPSRPTP